MSDWKKELKELGELRSQGLINEQEFQMERDRIMASRTGGGSWSGNEDVSKTKLGSSPIRDVSDSPPKENGKPDSKTVWKPVLIFGLLCGIGVYFLLSSKEKLLKGDGYEAVLIPSGSFSMGCTEGDSDCESDEKPVHKVTISKSFYMMKTEVTQGLYEKVIGSNPSKFNSCGKDCPVEKVSWYDAVRFANKLSEQEGLTPCYQIGRGEEPSVSWNNKSCNGWRLPTEAEWEYASRGGNTSHIYSGSNNMDEVAWYGYEKSGKKTHPVGQLKPNGFGLYDMSGNVWEWVWDSYGNYNSSSITDPVYFDTSRPSRVLRGGSWDFSAWNTRVSNRGRYNASDRDGFLGFRILRTP